MALTAMVLRDRVSPEIEAVFVHATDDLELEILKKAADLYHGTSRLSGAYVSPFVVINGLQYYYEGPGKPGGVEKWVDILLGHNVYINDIVVTESAAHSGREAEEFTKLCQEREWRKVAIIAKPYHMPRCFLNQLGWAQERGLDISFFCLTVDCDWAKEVPVFHAATKEMKIRTRLEHLNTEIGRIVKYRELYEKGDNNFTTAAIEEGTRHLMLRRS